MNRTRSILAVSLAALTLLPACVGRVTSPDVLRGPNGLEIVDLRVGKGVRAVPGDTLIVHYEGRLEDGAKFDSSRDRGQPFTFVLGAGRVIRGWDEGLVGMRESGLRRLVVPPELGYGERGYPPVIPPNATLIFEVELLRLRPAVSWPALTPPGR